MPINTKFILKYLEISVQSVEECSEYKDSGYLEICLKRSEAFNKCSDGPEKRSTTFGEALLRSESSLEAFWDRKALEAAEWTERQRRALEGADDEAA